MIDRYGVLQWKSGIFGEINDFDNNTISCSWRLNGKIIDHFEKTKHCGNKDILRIYAFWQFYRYETDITRIFRS